MSVGLPPQGARIARTSLWKQKGARVTFLGLIAAIIAMGAPYILSRWSYVPPEPMKLSRDFLDLLQSGDLRGAYLLTDHGASVGTTLAKFEVKIRHELRIDAFPVHRPIQLIGTRGDLQSYGNRLRRWIMGRKIDPDQVIVDYVFGPPFEIRLASDQGGKWQITLFQSHAM